MPSSTHPVDETAPPPKLIALGRRRFLAKRSDGVRFRGLRLLWTALPLQFGMPQFRWIPCLTIRLAMTTILIEATGMFLASGAMTGRRAWGPRMSNADFKAERIGTIKRRRRAMSKTIDLAAEPYAFTLSPDHCALLIIDMQRDFLEPGGFGEMLGNDVSQLRRTIEPNRRLLAAWRAAGLPALHTREGHRPDLFDLPPAKKIRGRSATSIGDAGPMGRILVRGEAGHDIIAELYPEPGEPVIDKPGKGAFYATDLHAILQHRGVKQLVVTGVTTEVCVNTTVREANDRGYDCLVLEDCVGSYFPDFHDMGLKMIKAQGGIFGWVAKSDGVIEALVGWK
jgi:biuret amidohydrolase